jgi:glucosamine--fructose-6-phosphate aminotransferase (isomerizing)
MEREIMEQPAALQELHDRLPASLAKLQLRDDYEEIVLIARGSSDNAATYLRYLVEIYLQVPAILAAPSVQTVYGSEVMYRKALGVAISQSGESADVRSIVANLRSQGHDTLAITNTPGSPLAREADQHICLDVGKETSIAATKTYSASLLAAYHLASALGAGLTAPRLPDQQRMSRARSAATSAAEKVMACQAMFSLARGLSFASAQETALKLIECALIPCQSYSLADFAHGPMAIAANDVGAIVFGKAPDSLLATDCQVIAAPDSYDSPDSPISEIVFGQFLALEVARLKGIDPDTPRNLSKVTSTY